MRPITVSVTGAGNSAVVPINHRANPPGFSVAIIVSGTVNYTLQHTYDDVFASTFDPSTATWFDHATIAAQTANKEAIYTAQVTGVRVKQNSGAGTTTLKVLQPGY